MYTTSRTCIYILLKLNSLAKIVAGTFTVLDSSLTIFAPLFFQDFIASLKIKLFR